MLAFGQHNLSLCGGLWPLFRSLQPHFRGPWPHFVGLQPRFRGPWAPFRAFCPVFRPFAQFWGIWISIKSWKILKILKNHVNNPKKPKDAKKIPKITKIEKKRGGAHRQTHTFRKYILVWLKFEEVLYQFKYVLTYMEIIFILIYFFHPFYFKSFTLMLINVLRFHFQNFMSFKWSKV